jgi:hypothetical protein
MDLEFSGEVWFWKGPAPHHFVSVPDEECSVLESVAAAVSYGWTTSLWPKDGGYVVPLKAAVRAAEKIELGDRATVVLTVEV